MSTFSTSIDQAAFDAAFNSLSAAQAADIVLGRCPLTADQTEALRLAEGSGGYRLRFDPAPVGHVGFSPAGTGGTGNSGWHVIVPATPECRRLVNAARREEFAKRIGAPRSIADRIFTEAHGYEPALSAAVAVWPLLSRCHMSNRALRDAGFRPGHPHEGAGIHAVRLALGLSD